MLIPLDPSTMSRRRGRKVGTVRVVEAWGDKIGSNRLTVVYSRSKVCNSTDPCLPYVATRAQQQTFHPLLVLASPPSGLR